MRAERGGVFTDAGGRRWLLPLLSSLLSPHVLGVSDAGRPTRCISAARCPCWGPPPGCRCWL